MSNVDITITEQDFERLSQLIQHMDSDTSDLLGEELSRAKVVKANDIGNDIVTMNSTIRFMDEEAGKESEMTLVYPKDADVNQNKVSVLAPVGIALLGLRVGQSIEWPMPNGNTRTLKVIHVLYQPESKGDWDL